MTFDLGAQWQIIATYKARLNKIACRHFNYGQGECPFGTSCFYEHRYRDGSLQQPTAPRLKVVSLAGSPKDNHVLLQLHGCLNPKPETLNPFLPAATARLPHSSSARITVATLGLGFSIPCASATAFGFGFRIQVFCRGMDSCQSDFWGNASANQVTEGGEVEAVKAMSLSDMLDFSKLAEPARR